MKKLLFLSLILFYTSCSKNNVGAQVDLFAFGEPTGEVNKKNLDEASGLAASIKNPGHLWTLNDSGNGAEVFLIDQKADIKLTCRLNGIKNRDWEDIAVGPGPEEGKSYIYVGDIGDNNAEYPLKYIYRFQEPVLTSSEKEIEITEIDQITFKLSDKQKDTECLLLNPQTKDLYVISKREKPVFIYQLKYPFSTTDTLTATQLISIPLTNIVGGSISSDGSEVLLKNYDFIYYWKTGKDKDIIQAIAEVPQKLPYKPEPQGEAITWARDGSGFFTISENVTGKRSYLLFYKRK